MTQFVEKVFVANKPDLMFFSFSSQRKVCAQWKARPIMKCLGPGIALIVFEGFVKKY